MGTCLLVELGKESRQSVILTTSPSCVSTGQWRYGQWHHISGVSPWHKSAIFIVTINSSFKIREDVYLEFCCFDHWICFMSEINIFLNVDLLRDINLDYIWKNICSFLKIFYFAISNTNPYHDMIVVHEIPGIQNYNLSTWDHCPYLLPPVPGSHLLSLCFFHLLMKQARNQTVIAQLAVTKRHQNEEEISLYSGWFDALFFSWGNFGFFFLLLPFYFIRMYELLWSGYEIHMPNFWQKYWGWFFFFFFLQKAHSNVKDEWQE